MSETIIAIDLGQYKCVACGYARTSREHTFTTFDTTPAALGRLLARHPGGLVVIEACTNAGFAFARTADRIDAVGWRSNPARRARKEVQKAAESPRNATVRRGRRTRTRRAVFDA